MFIVSSSHVAEVHNSLDIKKLIIRFNIVLTPKFYIFNQIETNMV